MGQARNGTLDRPMEEIVSCGASWRWLYLTDRASPSVRADPPHPRARRPHHRLVPRVLGLRAAARLAARRRRRRNVVRRDGPISGPERDFGVPCGGSNCAARLLRLRLWAGLSCVLAAQRNAPHHSGRRSDGRFPRGVDAAERDARTASSAAGNRHSLGDVYP